MNLQEKRNHFSEICETEAINLEKVASFFQDTIRFHPGRLQPKTFLLLEHISQAIPKKTILAKTHSFE